MNAADAAVLRLSSRARQVRPSPILAIDAQAKALVAQGRDIVLFGAGEPDFPTPPHIIAATEDALRRGVTKYTASRGTVQLREAIAARYSALPSGCSADQVIVTAGAKMALFEVFQAVCDPGDEAILFGPYWTSYAEIAVLAGATPVIVPTRAEDDFIPDPERLRAALTPRTRLVLVNSPGNPTGAVYPAETIQALARVLEGTNVLVVSDDIYSRILFDGRTFTNFAQLGKDWQARTIVIDGASKSYSMTGFRIGWASGPREIIAAMSRIQDQSTSNPTSFAQAGALAALTGSQDTVVAMAARFEQRRDLMVTGLRAMPGVECTSPGGAFYAFPKVASLLGRTFEGRKILTSADLAGLMLERFGVALVPGGPFGAPDHLRLSFAASEQDIVRGLARLQAGFAALV